MLIHYVLISLGGGGGGGGGGVKSKKRLVLWHIWNWNGVRNCRQKFIFWMWSIPWLLMTWQHKEQTWRCQGRASTAMVLTQVFRNILVSSTDGYSWRLSRCGPKPQDADPLIVCIWHMQCQKVFCDFVGSSEYFEIEGILPKGPYLPCVSIAGRTFLAAYNRNME